MREDAVDKMGGVGKVFFIGEVVRVPVADVDKAKVDNSNLTGVLIEINAVRMRHMWWSKQGSLNLGTITINSAVSGHLEITSSC